MFSQTDVEKTFSSRGKRGWSGKSGAYNVAGDDRPLDAEVDLVLEDGITVADIGCGNGKDFLRRIEGGRWEGGLLYLVDLARGMIEGAQIPGSMMSVLRVVADGSHTPIPGNSCDLVTLRQVLQHVPNPDAVARETHRIVRPGGQVLVQVPGPSYLSLFPFAGSHADDAIGRFSKEELRAVFDRAGFTTEVRSQSFKFTFPTIAALLDQMRAVGITDRTGNYRSGFAAAVHSFLDTYRPVFEQPLGSVYGEYLLLKGTK